MTGLDARSLTGRSVQAIALAGVFGLAPLAASTPDTASVTPQPASSAAVIELMPLTAKGDSDVTDPAAAPPASSAPQDIVIGRGSASFYAAHFDGRRTASGERFDNADMTAAHRTLPFGSLVRVSNPANGRSVVVRINDRGPFVRGRMIDVSRAAAQQLGLVARGHGTVELTLIDD